MSVTLRILLIASALALLASMFFYPFGYDSSVFAVGGELLVQKGLTPFRDFIDTKPPLIFLIYGLSSLIFGHHEWSIRLFDALFHIISLLYLYNIFKRTLANENIAFTSVIVYVFLYVLGGFWWTAQAESFALLPMIMIYDAAERIAIGRKNLFLGTLIGLATGLLLLLKPTLLVVPFASFLYLLFYIPTLRKKESARQILFAVISASIILGGFIVYLILNNAWTPFLEWIPWVGRYANVNEYALIEDIYKNFPVSFIATFGISTIGLAAIGGYIVSKQESDRARTYAHLALQIGLGLAGILAERKYFPYQYARMFWAAVPFIAIGLTQLLQRYCRRTSTVENGSRVSSITRKIVLTAGLASIFFYTIIPRIVSQPVHWAWLKLNGGDYAQDVDRHFRQCYYSEDIAVAKFLQDKVSPTESVFLFGNTVSLYFHLDRYATKFGLTNTPLVTAWTPQSWKDSLLKSLKENPPKFFISEWGDERMYITGDTLDSWQHIQGWGSLQELISTNYTPLETIGHFYIFQRTLTL